MRLALRQAERAAAQNEVPIGAVIVHGDEVIARAYNQVETLNDATAHAEILAITQASESLQNWRLSDCTLYVTKEPCPMCAGALINARIDRIVYALRDDRGGGCGGAFDITNCDGLLHKAEVKGGLLELESLEVIQDFFKRRRRENKEKRKDNPLPGC